jgi:hypothetical protein
MLARRGRNRRLRIEPLYYSNDLLAQTAIVFSRRRIGKRLIGRQVGSEGVLKTPLLLRGLSVFSKFADALLCACAKDRRRHQRAHDRRH